PPNSAHYKKKPRHSELHGTTESKHICLLIPACPDGRGTICHSRQRWPAPCKRPGWPRGIRIFAYAKAIAKSGPRRLNRPQLPPSPLTISTATCRHIGPRSNSGVLRISNLDLIS